MNTHILTHGMYTGAWCWNKVIPLLQKAGHQAVAFDLPGHGGDQTPISKISLQSYVDKVCQVLDSQSGPVILVGHSFGGIVITQVAEYRPDKIKKLVYLCALFPQNGDFSIKLVRSVPDSAPLMMQTTVVSEDKSFHTVKLEFIKELFYADCSDDDVNRARSLLCAEPMGCSFTPVRTTAENFGRIPRVYIQTLQDKALSPSFQEKMYSMMPFQTIIHMNTSHSPFFSAPEELAAHLLSL